MKLHKNNIIAGIGTAIIMAVLLLFLIFCGMAANTPLSEEGLTVNFGMVDLSQGLFEPYSETNSSTPQEDFTPTQPATPPATAEVPSEQELITQEEESVDLAAEAKKKAEEEARLREEERRRLEEEQRRLEEERKRQEQERQAAEIKNQVANVFGSQKGSESSNQGQGEVLAGNQGQVQGNTESANQVGSGSGYGDFSLDGRSHMGALPRPSFNIEAEGVVMVRIVVNNEGHVISASIDLQGTDTDNMDLRNAALSAAKQAKFNAIQTKGNQAGSITYRFRLR
ncbi:MAG: energy transducer TonB [Bacteroidales bacterium]|nr:energy transducer TonB [Bacteroidales bacterium]